MRPSITLSTVVEHGRTDVHLAVHDLDAPRGRDRLAHFTAGYFLEIPPDPRTLDDYVAGVLHYLANGVERRRLTHVSFIPSETVDLHAPTPPNGLDVPPAE